MSAPRTQVRISKSRAVVLPAMLVALALTLAALLEWFLEKRDVERLTATETFAQIGQARVRYRLLGADKPGPTVVLLNGILASAEQWGSYQRDLSQKHPVLAYDRGGSGFSDSSAYGGVEQARELTQLLDVLHIKQPVLVVGYSIASLEARLFADQFPDRTAGLILFDPYFPEKDLYLPGAEPSIRRSYVRTFTSGSLTALFGIRRLIGWRHAQQYSDPDDERSAALLYSFHFWWAETRDWWEATETERRVLEARGPLPPLLYLSNPIAQDDPVRPLMFKFVARSPQGEIRFFPHLIDHSGLLMVDETRDFLTAAVDDFSTPAVLRPETIPAN